MGLKYAASIKTFSVLSVHPEPLPPIMPAKLSTPALSEITVMPLDKTYSFSSKALKISPPFASCTLRDEPFNLSASNTCNGRLLS